MASVQARHHPSCTLGDGAWRFRKAGTKGCTCPRSVGPVYHVHYRENGKPKYEHVGLNLEAAKRAARQIEDRLDESRLLAKLGARPKEREDATFTDWSRRWFDGLARAKPSTKHSYASTLDYARATFGDRVVRVLDVADVQSFLDTIRKGIPGEDGVEKRSGRVGRFADGKAVSNSTLAKHLRVLSACLDAAVSAGVAGENPVRKLPKTHRPAAPAQSVATYFTDAELAKLWTTMPTELPAVVFTYLCKLAVTTGMRQGELLGLRWSDVKLFDSEVELQRTYSYGKDADGKPYGETSPKSGKGRTIDLTPAAQKILEEWMVVSGAEPGSASLVFSNVEGAHIVPSTITRFVLYPAMVRAGIPREGEHGRKRDFHSFRHTFARITLQAGAEITWAQRQLGHSSITLTVDRYGRWDRKGEKRQAKALKGAFSKVV